MRTASSVPPKAAAGGAAALPRRLAAGPAAAFARRFAAFGLAAIALAWPGAPTAAQQPADDACAAPAHAAFDFWIGRWEVRNPDGRVVGHNEIRRVAGGCGLLESWTGTSGSVGTSLNMYEPSRDAWTQTWVGDDGTVLHLEGGLEGEAMVLSGTRATPDGELLDRITWTPLEDGRVRQRWDVSGDGGDTWESVFIGLYSRTGGGRP